MRDTPKQLNDLGNKIEAMFSDDVEVHYILGNFPCIELVSFTHGLLDRILYSDNQGFGLIPPDKLCGLDYDLSVNILDAHIQWVPSIDEVIKILRKRH